MDDLNQQLRRHYEGQQLPADRVQEILAAGYKAKAARERRRWWRMAAAIMLLGLGGFGVAGYFRERNGTPATPRITPYAVAAAVVSYFSDPNYQLPQVSGDRDVLVGWLRQHGGPADFKVPSAMAGLSSYGCQVLEVQGQKVFLICFLLDAPPTNTPPGTMPEKKMMVTVGSDGRMMKKSVPLVHLVVIPRSKLTLDPKAGERLVLSAGGEWNYSAWTQGDQVYVAAAALPADRLAGLVGAL